MAKEQKFVIENWCSLDQEDYFQWSGISGNHDDFKTGGTEIFFSTNDWDNFGQKY